MGPSGKLRDKEAHERSFLLKARVMKVKEAHTYTKERQILGMTRMIHHMTAPNLATAPGWALRYRTYRRITTGFHDTGIAYAWQQEKRFADDPEIYVNEPEEESPDDSSRSGESDSGDHSMHFPEPGNIFASYEPCDYCHTSILIRDKKEFRRSTKILLGVGPPNVDNTDCRARPQWLSCLHSRRRAKAHAEVKNLIESWDGEGFEFRRCARTFEAQDAPDRLQECFAITVRPVWIKRTQPEPFFTEDSVRTTQNQAHVL